MLKFNCRANKTLGPLSVTITQNLLIPILLRILRISSAINSPVCNTSDKSLI